MSHSRNEQYGKIATDINTVVSIADISRRQSSWLFSTLSKLQNAVRHESRESMKNHPRRKHSLCGRGFPQWSCWNDASQQSQQRRIDQYSFHCADEIFKNDWATGALFIYDKFRYNKCHLHSFFRKQGTAVIAELATMCGVNSPYSDSSLFSDKSLSYLRTCDIGCSGIPCSHNCGTTKLLTSLWQIGYRVAI